MPDVITMRLEDHQLQVLLSRARFQTPAARASLGEGVRDAIEVVRAQAVRNVSGYPVTYTGGVFRVNVQTGALKGAIESEWPYGNPLQGRVLVNGAHTAASQAPGFYSKPKPVGEYLKPQGRFSKVTDEQLAQIQQFPTGKLDGPDGLATGVIVLKEMIFILF